MAKSYCEWRESRLPSSDEWVLAIQGENKNLIYPWSEEPDNDCTYANYAYEMVSPSEYKYCFGVPVAVGSYELGKSTFNIYDLIGNVAEWSQTRREVLGGSWASYKPTGPHTLYSDLFSKTIGFRCAKSP